MVVTTRVRLDRISSATRNAALTPEVIVGDQIVSAEGYVLAVRILADKSTYNTVEDVTGRMLSLRAGDVLAGVLGTRRALRGYAGVVPPSLAVGDTIEVLNLGGILGSCTSVNPEIGPPFQAEVLGAILAFPELGDRIGRPAHIRDRAVPPADTLESRVPVVYVAGTCMNAGRPWPPPSWCAAYPGADSGSPRPSSPASRSCGMPSACSTREPSRRSPSTTSASPALTPESP